VLLGGSSALYVVSRPRERTSELRCVTTVYTLRIHDLFGPRTGLVLAWVLPPVLGVVVWARARATSFEYDIISYGD
jgi:hypothetical protein